MTKVNFKNRVGLKKLSTLNFQLSTVMIALAIITFASCDSGDEGDDSGLSTVNVTITNLPAGAGSSGMEGQILVYPVKPPQTEDIEDGITTGVLMGGSADLIPVNPKYGSSPYTGGKGYLRISTVNTLPLAGTNLTYRDYIGKKEVTLKKGKNTFDFATDFEVLHQYGGEEGILTITDVPKEIVDANLSYTFIVTDYQGMTDEGDATFDLAMNAKPLAKTVHPTNDYLAKPLNKLENQLWQQITIDGWWTYDISDDRYSRNGMYFIYTPEGSERYPARYACQVVFTYGNATISWNDLKAIN